jgi:hypothetical protein
MKVELEKPQIEEDVEVNVYGGRECTTIICGLEW